ncbi:hypothetical protein HN592_03820 [Candidatus Woesearchaeota archaeon]|jgi:hypothetical protein|nr:hypothetical protein [Candidatus Woesearchaeota archaeon]MBT4368341.1 hypothetical protein [Candidatus Woesearchaeota archaeon]MBT4712830.1 hypothetical protein [Candidatus Woesearchaeota archaeon]MBT6639742.1 hypothetical protein [Candidatus Woesearchaeota archaeon]MBT7133914.1 hypothetical protein [Candidatus Woesearchaeota archaeon]
MFENRTVVGLIEEVIILNGKERKIKARIDTGATKSSIDATLLKKLDDVEEKGTTTIKSSHGVSKRRVVHLKIILGEQEVEGEFSVFDRGHMTYQILIGQNILEQNFIIDPKKEVEE